jgi:adenylate kinase
VGATLDSGEEEEMADEENENNEEGEGLKKKENTYRIYGSVKNADEYKKPETIKEIINTNNKEDFLEQLMECDIIIYDIISDPDQIDEACWAISALHSEIEKIDKPKTFILLSTCMTWAKTKPADPVNTQIITKIKLKLSYFLIFKGRNRYAVY